LLTGLRVLGREHGAKHVARGIRLGGKTATPFSDRRTQRLIKGAQHVLHAQPREAQHEIGKTQHIERIDAAASRVIPRRCIAHDFRIAEPLGKD
jgi:hypothetical protein